MFLSSTRRTPRRPLLGLLTAGALTAGLLVTGASPALAVTPLASTALETQCPAFTGGLTSTPLFTDEGIAVFVGGNYTALSGAKESEGVLVSQGSVTIDTGELMNLGVVGAGSQFTPPGGSDMVLAAGAVMVESGRVEVAHRLPRGGNVVAGKAIEGPLELNGGTKTPHSPVPAPQARMLRSELEEVSADLATKSATGRLDGKVLTGDGTAALQVFSLTSAQLAGLGGEVTFANVGPTAPIVVNVTGPKVNFSMIHTAADSVANRIDDGVALGRWAPRILWNFPDATTLTMTSSSQTVGSILAPRADVAQKTHTNGRLYIGGNLTFGGQGTSGLEHHNFPWIGSTTLGCETTIPKNPGTGGETDTGTEEEKEASPTDEPTAGPAKKPTPTPTDTAPAVPLVDGATPAAEPRPSPSATSPAQAAQTATGQEDGGLAATGAQTALIAVVALALLAGGTWLALLARRKRASS